MPADRLREPVRYLVFSASLRRGSLNTKLADLAAASASTHYPCVKRAWVEYLGEHPEPALDRVE
jgi:NAD(P)H-dependent FMN reductase